jgi:hypothetical protein
MKRGWVLYACLLWIALIFVGSGFYPIQIEDCFPPAKPCGAAFPFGVPWQVFLPISGLACLLVTWVVRRVWATYSGRQPQAR